MNKDEITKIVDQKCAEIAEHVDTVQIFVTMHDGGEKITGCYEAGIGNFYARQGQVQEWLTIQSQFQKNHAIRKDQE